MTLKLFDTSQEAPETPISGALEYCVVKHPTRQVVWAEDFKVDKTSVGQLPYLTPWYSQNWGPPEIFGETQGGMIEGERQRGIEKLIANSNFLASAKFLLQMPLSNASVNCLRLTNILGQTLLLRSASLSPGDHGAMQ
ncbi:hypothetical protein M407DRAFT_9505 [Tulasnella calospora MUT 4182]|uniref:Uncharacterized protein n=1 Tax=Tulasnella calospora MUT 4182 TaxID=1051891 RepID=A0A0C3Q3H2_9AGAM|nr:hypothetical protein M407DRAFT_9505 [Tulasnella calospora MUT 4182]